MNDGGWDDYDGSGDDYDSSGSGEDYEELTPPCIGNIILISDHAQTEYCQEFASFTNKED